jgi:hypothetical protein
MQAVLLLCRQKALVGMSLDVKRNFDAFMIGVVLGTC